MFDFFWVPVFTFLMAVLIILLLRPLATMGGLLDVPDARKRHEGAVPLVGGLAIALAVWAGCLMFLRSQGYYSALLAGITLLALVGFVDDRRGMSPMTKLGAQIFAAILMTSWGGVYLSSLGDLLGRREIELVNWGIPLTLFAVVAVINAMNMSDGMDGLAGGLALTMFLWFAYLAEVTVNAPAQRVAVIFCGAIAGFLLFNMRNPLQGKLRVFLGDAGSLTLGYAIVWFSVELSQVSYNNGSHVPPVVMLWIVGFVLIDLLAVVLRRAIKRRNPLSADRSHLHHILQRLGISPGVIVWLIIASNALLGAVGIFGWRMGVSEQLLFIVFLGLTLVHLLLMHNAWRCLRIGRRLIRRRAKGR